MKLPLPPSALIAALSEATGEEAPANLTRTVSLPVRFDLAVEKEDMAKFVFGEI